MQTINLFWKHWVVALAVLVGLGGGKTLAQTPFFPGAEGFGGTFNGTTPTGGWFADAEVYHVTTTQDFLVNGKGAPGTLRGAFVNFDQPNSPKQNAANRIVVFDVGGTFELTQGKLDIKDIDTIYVAGHTAPSPVTVYGNMSQITKQDDVVTKNVIIRHMAFRKGTGPEEDAVSFIGGDGVGDTIATNMILDHVTASWAEDENLSVANNNTNVTVQYSIIHDALVSNHAYGSLIRPRVDSQVTFHHNLYANNSSRQARFGTYNSETLTADFRNNVVYNFRDRASYAGGSSETDGLQEEANVNYVGNYIIAGPGTIGNPSVAFSVDKNVTTQVYYSGNYIDPDEKVGDAIPNDGVLDGAEDTLAAGIVLSTPVTDQTLALVGTPFTAAPVTTQSAPQAYTQIVNYVGNHWWDRDDINNRVIGNVTNFTGMALAASDPNGTELSYVTGAAYPAAPTTHLPNYDSDNDGMPNTWETEHGLNPNSAADAVTYDGNNPSQHDFDLDGYTNLQEYLDDIGAFPCPVPIDYAGPPSGAGARYALINHWKTTDGVTAGSFWQPSKFDLARINSGTVRVDAIGQRAGTLLVAPGATNATLNVLSGWIKVTDELVVGSGTGIGTVIVAAAGDVYADTVVIEDNGRLQGLGEVIGDVWNDGLVTPGVTATPIGTLTVTGDFMQDTGGILRMEINSLASFDRLVVNGAFLGSGMLDIELGYSPLAGDSWNLLDFTSAVSSIVPDLPPLAGGLVWDTDDLLVDGTLSVIAGVPVANADFNNDDIVDGLDFLTWQQGFNSAGGLAQGDANESGFVDNADLTIWQNQYGTPGGLVAATTAVPEPASAVLFVLAAATIGFRRRLR